MIGYGMMRVEKCTKLVSNRSDFIQINVEFLLQEGTPSLTVPDETLLTHIIVDYFVEITKRILIL